VLRVDAAVSRASQAAAWNTCRDVAGNVELRNMAMEHFVIGVCSAKRSFVPGDDHAAPIEHCQRAAVGPFGEALVQTRTLTQKHSVTLLLLALRRAAVRQGRIEFRTARVL
jgi:hypothetical protein